MISPFQEILRCQECPHKPLSQSLVPKTKIEINFEGDLPDSIPYNIGKFSPVYITFRGKVKFTGYAETIEDSPYTVTFDLTEAIGKLDRKAIVADFEKTYEIARNEISIGVRLDPKSTMPILTFSFGSNKVLPIVMEGEWEWEKLLRNELLEVTASLDSDFTSEGLIIGYWKFNGKMKMGLALSFHLNPAWSGYGKLLKNIEKFKETAARAGQKALQYARSAGLLIRSAIFTQLGAYTAAGAALLGIGAAAVGLAAIMGVLYIIGKKGEEGVRGAIVGAFIDGYASMLAELSSDEFLSTSGSVLNAVEISDYTKLLQTDWKSMLEDASQRYMKTQSKIGNPLKSIRYAGEARAIQDLFLYITEHGGRNFWDRFIKNHQDLYGKDKQKREACYRCILRQKVNAGQELRIPI